MVSNFFNGSENLYKYLVTIGLLMVVLSVYYPLDNKEKLEIEKIELFYRVIDLNKKIKSNILRVKNIEEKNKLKTNDVKEFFEIKKLTKENEKIQDECIKNNEIIKAKNKYIKYYTFIFWFFFPIGIILIIYGFIKWRNAKKIEDDRANLEKTKVELEIKRLKENNKEKIQF